MSLRQLQLRIWRSTLPICISAALAAVSFASLSTGYGLSSDFRRERRPRLLADSADSLDISTDFPGHCDVSKMNDGKCDASNDISKCDYDGGDCSSWSHKLESSIYLVGFGALAVFLLILCTCFCRRINRGRHTSDFGSVTVLPGPTSQVEISGRRPLPSRERHLVRLETTAIPITFACVSSYSADKSSDLAHATTVATSPTAHAV